MPISKALPFGYYATWLERAYTADGRADEVHTATTADGISLAMFRYRPAKRPLRTAPVLMVHGLGANRTNFDLTREYSLARDLAGRGFDCWLLDLRGCGGSMVQCRRWSWTFDDYAELDIPAAIDLICRETGRDRVHWIGHSMGGMLLYAYLLRGDARRIRSGVTLGSPARFSGDRKAALLLLEPVVKALPQLPVAGMLRNMAPLLGAFGVGSLLGNLNAQNVDWNVIRTAAYNCASHLAPGVLSQCLDWIRTGDFRTADGSYSYRDHLHAIRAPLLVVAGAQDGMVRLPDARLAYERAASKTKAFLPLSRDNGFSTDYGHIDMMFGRRAREEVYPRVAAWLEGFAR